MGMVEKVARAIYEDRHGKGCVPWSRRSSAHKAPYLSDARAAIKSMMDIPDALTIPGGTAIEEAMFARQTLVFDGARDCFQAILRAALEAEGGRDG